MPRRHRLWTLGRPPRPTSSPASPLSPPASRPDSRSVHYYRSMIILSNCVAIATARVLYNSTVVLVFMSNCSPNISTSEQGQTSYSAYFGAASQSIITPATAPRAHRPVAAAPDFSVLPRSGFSLSCRWRRSASQLLSFHARIPNPTILRSVISCIRSDIRRLLLCPTIWDDITIKVNLQTILVSSRTTSSVQGTDFGFSAHHGF